MKNKTKYLLSILVMLVAFLLVGTNKVNAAESGIAYKVDLGTVNVGYTEKPMGYINVHNNGTEAWAIWNVTVDREDIFNINGTNHDYVEPAYDSYEQYYVTAETGLSAGTYTGKITVATMSGYTMETTVTLKVVDPSAKNNVLVTDATDFINAVNKTNAEDSVDLIKLQDNISMGENDELNWHIYKDTILDLNGNTLTLVNDKSINLIYHDNATLKITDSSNGKTGKIYKKKNNEIFYFFTVQENDASKKHDIAVLVDGIKIEREKQPEKPSTVFMGKSNYKLTVKDTTLNGLTYLLRSDDNVKVDLSIETIKLYTYSDQSMAVMARNSNNEFEEEMLIGNVIPEDSEFLYYNINDKQVVADRNLLISEPFVDRYDDDKTRSIIVRKKTGFDITDVSLNEIYGYTESTDVKEIPIYNSGAADLQIKNVSVDNANFVVEGTKTPIVNVGATNTDFKIKAKKGLNVGEYSANITVTDINDNTYTSKVTLKVDKKEITDLDISIDSWTYGVDDEKWPVINYGSILTSKDGDVRFASEGSDHWSWMLPTTAGKYKMKFKLTNDANEKYIIPEKIVNFEIFKNDTEIKIVIKSNSWEYDGEEHKEDDYDVYYGGTKLEYLPDAKMYKLPNKKQDRLLLLTSGKVKDVSDGTVENGIFDYMLLNANSYSNVTIEKGTLSITPITTPIVVTANNDTKNYDGEDLTNKGYTYTNDVLLAGDELTATITGKQKYVGTSDNKVTGVKVTRDGKDITSNYTFGTHVNGTLEVKQSSQIITAEENLYVKVDGTLAIDKIKKLLNCNLTDYNIKYISGSAGTFDETTGFTAGATTGKIEMEVIAPAKDVNNDGINEYAEARQKFYINVVEKETVTFSGIEDNQVFIYNGEKQKPIGRIEVIGGNVNMLDTKYKGTGTTNYDSANAPKNAGTYTVTYSVPEDNPDYVGSVTYAFTIKKAQLNKPTASTTSFVYDGTSKGYSSFHDNETFEFTGTNKATNVGNYSITISLKDKDNYELKDGTTTDVVINWSITQATPEFTVPTGLTGVKGDFLSSITLPAGFTWNNSSELLTAGTHTYKATYTPTDTINYKTVTDIEISVVVKNKFVLSGVVNGGNGTISVSSLEVLEGKKAEVIFTPDEGYMIDKVLVEGTEVEVTGNKLELTMDGHKLVVVSYKKIPFTVTVEDVEGATVDPSGVVTVNYGDNKNFTITANSGYKLIKVLVNGTEKTLDGNTLKLTNITANMNIKVVVEKIVYEVIEGAEQTYTITEDTEARFRIDADYSLFNNKVYVDNVLVDSSNYTSKSGSTIIVLNKEYVDTLAVGEHTLKVAFTDGGEAETTFTIARKAEDNNNNEDNNENNNENNTPSKPENKEEMKDKDNGSNPKTGDNIILYVAMASISIIGLGAIIIVSKMKKKN